MTTIMYTNATNDRLTLPDPKSPATPGLQP